MNGRAGESAISLSAVLLAGGGSRRMGRDKATMKFGGQPMWGRQMDTLRDLGPAKIFVSARSRPEWLPNDVELLIDDVPSRGPLGGIVKALTAMETTHLLAFAVDMPLITAEQLQQLLALAQPGCGVVPLIGDRAEPLAALYPAETASDFEAAFAGSDFSLQSVVRKLAAAGKLKLWAVPEADRKIYRSINTPADMRQARFPNRSLEDFGGEDAAAP
ncbi:MAG: molybdenum cofactor guanylyltransferase [Chthoniobacterales bacterium]